MRRVGFSNQMIFIAASILSIGQPASAESIVERDFKSVHGSSDFARGATAEARLISIATSFPRLVGRSPVELKKALGPNDGKAEIGSGRNKIVSINYIIAVNSYQRGPGKGEILVASFSYVRGQLESLKLYCVDVVDGRDIVH